MTEIKKAIGGAEKRTMDTTTDAAHAIIKADAIARSKKTALLKAARLKQALNETAELPGKRTAKRKRPSAI